MALLGSTASDEDRKRYKEALNLINKENPQGVFASHPQFKTTLKQVLQSGKIQLVLQDDF